jgi:hypothetical protein
MYSLLREVVEVEVEVVVEVEVEVEVSHHQSMYHHHR